MSGIASPSPIADACDPAAAAMTRLVALFHLVGRLGRTCFALARTAKHSVDKARSEGASAYVLMPRLSGALNLVTQALLLADALRWRLRTPALRLALMAERPEREDGEADGAARPRSPRRPRWLAKDLSDPLARIQERRHHPEALASIRRLIAPMSDAEVINYAATYLLSAAAFLGDVPTTRIIQRLIGKALGLFDADQAEVLIPRVCGALTPKEQAAVDAAVAADAAYVAQCVAAAAEAEAAAGAPEAAEAPDAMGRGPPIV